MIGIGIVGYGNIGKTVAKIADAFGMNVLVYNRSKKDIPYKQVDKETVFKESDFLTIHCPLNESTKNLINAEKIALMKDTVVLVNEARGAVINEHDVTEAILSGKIGAFGSDVYSIEPFPDTHPFYKIKDLDNVILTPHAAWAAYEARERCLNIISENISAFTRGERKNRVD